MNPMEILLKQKRDEASMNSMVSGLRRNQDISRVSQLSGDPILGKFGGTLGDDTQLKMKLKLASDEKASQRDIAQGQYDQGNSYRSNVLKETIRHNKAVEEANLFKAQHTGVATPKDVDRGVQKLSAQLDKGGTPELNRAMQAVREELNKYKEEGSDIPGFGAGRFKPLFTLGEAGKALRTKVQAVTNILLKKRSGGAVTPQEAERLGKEFGATLGLSDQDFLNAWADLEQTFDAGMTNIYAGYGDQVRDQYLSNQSSYTRTPSEKPSSPPEGGTVVNWGDLPSGR